MKQLQKSDLKEGEIYKQLGFNYIFQYDETFNSFSDGIAVGINSRKYYKRWHGNDFDHPMIEATPEEKHWLEECIKADKFVSYEEAMKTFVPEYVECTFSKSDSYKLNKIYKVEKNTEYVESETGFWKAKWNNNSTVQSKFKPSTKEAYEAQFKEPEFVLPETWWIKITKENLEDISKFLGFKVTEYLIGNIAGMVKHYYTGEIQKGWNSKPVTTYGSTFGNEITIEQFKQYVLKEEPIVEKSKVVFEEPKDKVLKITQIRGKGTVIVQVECSEGGVYKIGDKITVFTHDSPNKGKVFTIKGFRWNNAKTNLCAITELHSPNGIGLDKIELYVEAKIKITHNFKIGDKISINANMVNKNLFIIENIEGNRLIINNEEGTLHNFHKSVLAKNAKLVIEDFVLPEKWCVRFNKEPKFIEWCNENTKTSFKKFECLSVTDSNYFHYPLNTIQVTSKNPNYTEITFEQFKKYVLKNE